MSIKLGNGIVDEMFIGNTPIQQGYLGNELVYRRKMWIVKNGRLVYPLNTNLYAKQGRIYSITTNNLTQYDGYVQWNLNVRGYPSHPTSTSYWFDVVFDEVRTLMSKRGFQYIAASVSCPSAPSGYFVYVKNKIPYRVPATTTEYDTKSDTAFIVPYAQAAGSSVSRLETINASLRINYMYIQY